MIIKSKAKILISAFVAVALSCTSLFADDSNAFEIDIVKENLDGVSESDKAVLKQDAEGKSSIPYSRFWLKNYGGPSYFMRASSHDNGSPYIGTGGYTASYYETHPLNWRMIQVGSGTVGEGYRLIKNSHTGKCIALNSWYNLLMRTCDTSNSTQKLRVEKNSLGQVYLYRESYRVTLHVSALDEYNLSNAMPIIAWTEGHPWFAKHLR